MSYVVPHIKKIKEDKMETIKGRNNKNLYREKIYIEGKEIKSPRFTRKTDAKLWKQNMLLQRSKSGANLVKFSQSSKVTFQAFADNFVENKVKYQLAYKTYEVYKSRLKVHMYPYFGTTSLKKISMVHMTQLIYRMKNSGHNATGINNIIRTFKRIISEAISEGYLLSNPFVGVKKLKEELRTHSYMSKVEIKKLLEANKDYFLYDLVLVALNTGMRRGELAGLCWDKIDLDNKLIEVGRTRDKNGLKETTKTGERRYIPMNETVFKVINELNNKTYSGYVFRREDGRPIDVHHIYRDFKSMLKNAGIKKEYRFHDLRHTFGSHFMMNDGNLYDLQKILGHTKPEMTNRYAHLSKNHLIYSMDKFNLS